MSLVWRNFVIDPLKAVMFGRSFEFIFGMIFGGCALEDAAMGVMQDEIEGSTEAAAEGAADVVDDMAGDGVAAEVAGDGLLDGGELTAGADGRRRRVRRRCRLRCPPTEGVDPANRRRNVRGRQHQHLPTARTTCPFSSFASLLLPRQ
jgi:hypothetical protein